MTQVVQIIAMVAPVITASPYATPPPIFRHVCFLQSSAEISVVFRSKSGQLSEESS